MQAWTRFADDAAVWPEKPEAEHDGCMPDSDLNERVTPLHSRCCEADLVDGGV